MEQLAELLPVLEMTLSADERDACDALVPPGGVVDEFPQHRALDEDPDRMKVAFIGTHGTGKTTLCYDLTAALKRQGFNADMVKEVARLSPLPINRKTSLDAQTWILMTQVAEEIRSASAARRRRLRSQRARQLRVPGLCVRPPEAHRAVRRPLDEDVRRALQGADGRRRPTEDGVRDTDEFFIRSIDQLVDTLLAEKKIPHERLDAASRDGWVESAAHDRHAHRGLAGRLI